MSFSIWTRCAGASKLAALRAEPWRVVEAQHVSSTRKLVSSLEEQALLEELIDSAKPPDVTRGKLHYLLATPFRYPPLEHGTRFASRHERGIWYGSEMKHTAFAEVAYYRLVFLEGTRANLGTLDVPLTAFTARLRTSRAIDLTRPPFDAHKRSIASRTSYSATQSLGAEMRAAGVEVFRYPSARDVKGGANIGIFSLNVFGGARPRNFENWFCLANRNLVEVSKQDYFGRETFGFRRSEFLVRGQLPLPAI